MNTGGVAAGFIAETIPAVTEVGEGPYWEVLPEHTRVTLQGYPVSSHLMQPQIFIYPVEELIKVNEGTGQIAASAASPAAGAPGDRRPCLSCRCSMPRR